MELNSLRGIASLVVVIYHASLAFPVPDVLHLVFAPVLNAHGAVVLFFVLSGYVLALSWQRLPQTIISVGRFFVRRVARIYPAIWIATLIGVPALFIAAAIASDPNFTPWMFKYVVLPTPLQVVLGLAGADNTVLMPLWTIYVELIGSFLIPPMVWIASRNRAAALALILVLAVIACAALHWHKAALPARYLVYFAMGVALALYPPRFVERRARITLVIGILTITLGPVLYMFVKTGAFQPSTAYYPDYSAGFIEGAGSAIMIAALTSGGIDAKWLRSISLQKLGERSYGLYLIHSPLLILIASALPLMAPVHAMLIAMVATAILSILISGLVFRYVELPGIALGKKLTASPDHFLTFGFLRRQPHASPATQEQGR